VTWWPHKATATVDATRAAGLVGDPTAAGGHCWAARGRRSRSFALSPPAGLAGPPVHGLERREGERGGSLRRDGSSSMDRARRTGASSQPRRLIMASWLPVRTSRCEASVYRVVGSWLGSAASGTIRPGWKPRELRVCLLLRPHRLGAAAAVGCQARSPTRSRTGRCPASDQPASVSPARLIVRSGARCG
jgi:hypothetical protein